MEQKAHILQRIDSFLKKFYMLLKKYYVVIMSFLFPVIILQLAYIICGIYPFGKWDLLIIDLYHQYAPFISDLQEKFKSFSSLLYSWSGGLGTNFLPLYAYYLASPLNFITFLFPKEHLTEAVLILTLLKAGLAGACFAIYLKGIHNKENLITTAFALLYALSGYVLAFSWNIMWMDAIYLLPLIILGLVKLTRDSNGLLYCITLAITIFSNFYIGFFICLFLLLYYPLCLFRYNSIKQGTEIIKKTLKFAGFSILAAGLSAILLLPTFFALRATSAADDLFPKTLTHYFDFFDYVTRHFTAASPSIREGMPNLYCGIIVLILIPVYFLCKSIRLREKLMHLALLAILILSFNINILNFIWHGLHYPNQVPYRFSFVYIFLILSMSYDACKRLHEFTGKQIGMICTFLLGIVIISQKFDDLSLEYASFYSSIIAIILYAVAFTVNKSSKSRNLHFLKLLFVFLVIIAEITANTIITTIKIDMAEGYSQREGYSSGKEVAEIRKWIYDIKKEDNDFYRMEIIPPKTANDPFLYNYRGLSIFSSTLPVKTVKMFRNMGYHSNNINSYEYEGSTPILDSLFGIKYLLYRSMDIEEHIYQHLGSSDGITVYKNPYALSLGFLAPKRLKNFYSAWSDPFNAQNSLINYICGINDIFTPIRQEQGAHYNLTFSSSETKYYSYTRTNKELSSMARIRFHVENDQHIYLYFRAPYKMEGEGVVKAGGKKLSFNPKHSAIINPGFCKSGTLLELELSFDGTAPESGRFEIYAYGLNQQAFEKAMALIKQKSMTIDSYTDTRIIGTVKAENDSLMVMTIPYNNGWQIKVDKQERETIAIDDCLLAFEIEEGFHEIELWFVPERFHTGAVITLASIIILVLLILKNQVKMYYGIFRRERKRS